MTDASIPVDLFNPGQVFACLGFLEAADSLLGAAEGGFDWTKDHVRFHLNVRQDVNPFCVVLDFLADSQVRPYAPSAHEGSSSDVAVFDSFPATVPDGMALPLQLVGFIGHQQHQLEVGHWADDEASGRNRFKLYSGNRSAADIARSMLFGTRGKSKPGGTDAEVKTKGLRALWQERRQELAAAPFDVLTAVGGSFNFDPRGAWTGIDAGYSPNRQQHGIAASPVLEILAAIGLQNARPNEYEPRKVRYAAWASPLPAVLARPALADAQLCVPSRAFTFELRLSGKNKVVTFAHEEIQ